MCSAREKMERFNRKLRAPALLHLADETTSIQNFIDFSDLPKKLHNFCNILHVIPV